MLNLEVQANDDLLSKRELEVLELIAHGYIDRQIAFILEIEDCTVRFHVRNILKTLQVKNRAAAVYRAFKNGWIN